MLAALLLLPPLSLAAPARAAAPPADPFAGVEESTAAAAGETAPDGAFARFFSENFGFRKELMSQFAAGSRERPSSRQSAGFEALKKFSTETKTLGSADFQGRVVRRDRFVPVQNDRMGMGREGWRFEYHNAYADLYDLGGGVGRLNARLGHFYVPFGLNLQTDTHGTPLQLSNERDFGFERDWYAGFYGAAGEALNYDAYYLAGSGYDLKWRGQSGLGAARLSLSERFSSRHGLEGGLSLLGGERLQDGRVTPTKRAGVDARKRQPGAGGLFTLTSELGGGSDVGDAVFSQLYQAEYLRGSRRWGLASQYRRFWRAGAGADGSVIAEASWYLRNDVGNSNLHWLKLNVERQLERADRTRRDTIVALQYYRYW